MTRTYCDACEAELGDDVGSIVMLSVRSRDERSSGKIDMSVHLCKNCLIELLGGLGKASLANTLIMK